MPTEIERKFLVDVSSLPESVKTGGGARFMQGYLSVEPVVRVRLSEREGRDPEAWITIKGAGTLSRAEYEYAVPAEHAREMMALCVAVLSKTRHHVEVASHAWDLDEYHGALDGFWLAEVELRDEREEFERPRWVTEEVTQDPTYTNVALALKILGKSLK